MSLSVAVVVGSLRRESINRRLAEALPRLAAAVGTDFAFPEIRDLPLYDQDDDASPAAPVVRLKAEIRAADAVIFVMPEYNRSIPGPLKNAIDHASRPYAESAWRGKPAGIVGASPGALGTALGQRHLADVCAVLGMPTLRSPEAYVQATPDLFDETGALAGRTAAHMDQWLAAFLDFARRNRA